MKTPKLSILIATQGRRNQKFLRLLSVLMPQVEKSGKIEVIAYWNNGEYPIGTVRQKLLEEASGVYTCFVDDDDLVPEYYCSEIMKALGKDYVGFKVQLFNEGVENRPVFHDLQYQVWTEDDLGFYRGVTHLNPIKRELALKGYFSTNGCGEDTDWARSVVPFVRDQNYIDKIMYYYYHDMNDTSFGGSWDLSGTGYRRPWVSNKYFRWHPDSKQVSKEDIVDAITNCRACESIDLVQFLDLGEQYLSDFRETDEKPPKYPIVAVLCNSCKLIQLKHTTPQYEMYHDRYGFKSGISDSIKNDLHDVVKHAESYKPNPKNWLDIASNDGTLLRFVDESTFRVGVDPVSVLCKEAKDHADIIVNDYFRYKLVEKLRKFDVITSVSCFYDMPDPNTFVKDVAAALADNGVWIIQQNYLLTTMMINAVDNFCHEHLEYYTLRSLENLLDKHGLEVNEVMLSDINGGSIRTVVSHKGTRVIDKSVGQQRTVEELFKVDDLQTYIDFSTRINSQLVKLRETVDDMKRNGKTVCILAASTRGATIWQSAGLDARQISYAVERNPAKVGKYFSAIGVPIVSEEYFREHQPDYAIIGPWFFEREIVKREATYHNNGGKFIIPLPEVKIV